MSTTLSRPLTRDESQLLTLFINHGHDLIALAGHLKGDIGQLIAWATQPHIQAALEALEQLEAFHHRRADRSRRETALDALEQTIEDSDDPRERRRAATTILRTLTMDGRNAPSGSTPAMPTSTPASSEPPCASDAYPAEPPPPPETSEPQHPFETSHERSDGSRTVGTGDEQHAEEPATTDSYIEPGFVSSPAPDDTTSRAASPGDRDDICGSPRTDPGTEGDHGHRRASSRCDSPAEPAHDST